MQTKWIGLALVTVLAACGQSANQDTSTTTTTTNAVTDASGPAESVIRNLAYDFRYAFRVGSDRLDDVQRAHVARCDTLGPARCLVLNATLDGRDGRFGRGTLELRVATTIARTLGDGLRADVDAARGELTEARVEGQDLDAAMLEASAALVTGSDARDRLRATASTDGPLGARISAQGVATEAAERADAVRVAAAELGRKLAVSRVVIGYESSLPVPTGQTRPLAAAWAGVGQVFSEVAAFLLTLLAGGLPFALAAALGWAGWRAWERRTARL